MATFRKVFTVLAASLLALTACEEDLSVYKLENPAMLLDNNTSRLTCKGEVVRLYSFNVRESADKRLELNFKNQDLRVSIYTFAELEGNYYITPHSEGLEHTSTAVVIYKGDYYEPTEGTVRLYPKKDRVISGQYEIKAVNPEKGVIHLETGLFKCLPNDSPPQAGSSPPLRPSSPYPPDGGVINTDTVKLRFNCIAPGGHKLTYKIWFGEKYNQQELVADGTGQAAHYLSGLKKNTQYYWRVAAMDELGNTVKSKVWTFTVR